MSDPKVFDMIEGLIEALPLDPEKAGKILGVEIVRDPAADTPAVEAYTQSPKGTESPYQNIDLRLPDPVMGNGPIFLSVTPKSDGGVNKAGIFERFGLEFQFHPPSPRYTPGTVPAYLVYEKAWGELTFGLSVDADERLVRFIISAKAGAAAPEIP